MTDFENYLVDKKYYPYRLNGETMKFESAGRHLISTMSDICYHYIHKDDSIHNKIEQGISVMDDNFTWEDRKNIICFGLHEKGKPPTLICPRPKIKVIRDNGVSNEDSDDSMNIVLQKESKEDIFKAIFDKSIVFEYDLR